MKTLRLAPYALLLAACAGAPPAPQARRTPPARPVLTVAALADFHGALAPDVTRTADGKAVESGGAALVSSYVARLRAAAPGPVLLVDGGDMFQGTMASNFAEGAPVVRFYDFLGVRAAALGNHDFDYGPVGREAPAAGAHVDPRGALRARAKEARFPILAANVVDATGHRPSFLKASTTVDAGGVKVGIVGAANVATPAMTASENVAGLSFLDPIPRVEAEARRLRSEGAQVIVLLYHEGSDCTPVGPTEGFAGCEPGPLLDLVRALPDGLVDVVVGAHRHGGVARTVGRTAVLEPFAQGQYLAWAEVRPDEAPRVHAPVRLCAASVDGPQGPTCDPAAVSQAQGEPHPARFLGAEIAPDAKAAALVRPDLERVAAMQARPLGPVLDAPLGISFLRESALGDLVADAMHLALPAADVAVTNGGSLRAELPAGPLTYGQVFAALPFDNRLAILKVDGRTLRRIVLLGHTGAHGALDWSGLSFEADGCEVRSIRVGGSDLDPARTYTVVTNDFLARGGGGFASLGLDPQGIEVRTDLPIVYDVVAQALAAHGDALLEAARITEASPREVLRGHCDGR